MFTCTASRARLSLLAPAVLLTALATLAVAPSAARAECLSSTPADTNPTFDAAADDFGGAPDIRELRVWLDDSCTLRVQTTLDPLPVLTNQYLNVQFDFDPPPPDPADELIDAEVYFFSSYDVVLDDGFGGLPLPGAEPAQFWVTIDELGLASSTQLGVAVAGVFDPTLTDLSNLDEVYGDNHPDIEPVLQPMVRVPVEFTQPSAPPPATSTTPASPAISPPPPPVVKTLAGCVVPKLKGLTVKKAKAALKKAGCKYSLKGKGRVRSVSPKAGTRTQAKVQVKAKRKAKKSRKRRGSRRFRALTG